VSEVSDQECAEYAAAAMIDLAVEFKSDGGVRLPCEELVDWLDRRFHVRFLPVEIEKARLILISIDLAEILRIGHSRPYFLISSAIFDRKHARGWNSLTMESRLERYPIIYAFRKLGRSWLRESLQKAFSERILERKAKQDAALDRLRREAVRELRNRKVEFPASDRLVKLSDNQPALDEARQTVSELKAKLETGNDIGDLSINELEVARREVYWIDHMLKQESLRLDWVEPLVTSSLKWIADKAAGTAVGKAAWAAITAFAVLFGLIE
jgi:hypothetical protein